MRLRDQLSLHDECICTSIAPLPDVLVIVRQPLPDIRTSARPYISLFGGCSSVSHSSTTSSRSLSMCHLMLSGILERHPKLRVMFAHAGGAVPGTLGRIQWVGSGVTVSDVHSHVRSAECLAPMHSVISDASQRKSRQKFRTAVRCW